MQTSKESPNLDVLRAAAVLMVFTSHIFQFVYPNLLGWVWDLGRFGVLIFFVHTSLVLMMSMERSGGQPLGFYIRRFFRIYPLSVATVVIVVLFRIPLDPAAPPATNHFGKIISNLALTMNLTGSDVVLGPLWSLPLEVQMYVVLPALFFAARRYRTAVFWVALWSACVTIAFLLQRFSSVHFAKVAYWICGGLIPFSAVHPFVIGGIFFWQFVPCFLGGVVAYVVCNRMRPVLSFYVWPIFIISSYVLYEAFDSTHRGWISCLVLGCAIPVFRPVHLPLMRTVAHAIAKYSYGIYLFHLIAIWVAFAHLRVRRPVQYLVCVAFTGVASFAAYHLLERPLIRYGQQLAARSTWQARHGAVEEATKVSAALREDKTLAASQVCE